jgi:hypothetical protein
MDGGSPYRLNNAVVNIPLGSAAAHVVFTQLNGDEDTESMVEELLLPSPLVTDSGTIVFVADNCTLMMYPDPAVSTTYTPDTWRRSIANWDVTDDIRGINEESQFAGVAIYNDVIYVLDGRNSALHAVKVVNLGLIRFSYQYTLYLNNSKYGTAKFNDGDTGIIPDPDNGKLWVVTPVSPFGGISPGLAVQIDMTTQEMTWLPLPERLVSDGCKKNYDEGSVSIGGVSGSSGIALLAGTDCGLVVIDSTGAMPYSTIDLDEKYEFNNGEHSHPLYDPDTNNLYWLDFQITFGSPQNLCCTTYSDQGFVDCPGWLSAGFGTTCVQLPVFEKVVEQNEIDFKWLWLAMGLQPASKDGSVAAQLYVSASATMDDETFLTNGLDDLTSALFQFDTASGSLKNDFRLRRDMFNSAPLIVTSSVDNVVQVYVSSSLGYIYCFAANGIATGPLWSSQDLAPIPVEDLPATTYTFLAVTQPGTILATSTAGGDSWQTQKATFAIKNGLVNPVVPPSSNAAAAAAQQASVAAGVSITVLILAAVGFWRAYSVVPSVKDATDSFVDKVTSTVSGRGQVKGVERASLRASGYSPVVSASASAGQSYGSYGSNSGGGGGVTSL